MIVRVWHGWTGQDSADAYQRLLDDTIVPGIIARGIPGLHGVEVLRRRASECPKDEVEFVTMMTFDDWTAVEQFAGDGGTTSVVPSAARALLRRFDDHSQHHERVAVHADAYRSHQGDR